jgi:shikimate kinase
VARLVLVGMPGVGKSTAAQALAARWNCAALDVDDVVATMVGSSAADFLRLEGEDAFREREVDALDQALRSDAVVSTGGGIVSSPRARERLKDEVTVWLDCDDASILLRLAGVDRPLLGDDPVGSLARLRAQREEWYREVARARIDASGSVDDVVDRLVEEVARTAR